MEGMNLRAYRQKTACGFFHTIPKKGEFGYDTWFERIALNTPVNRSVAQITV